MVKDEVALVRAAMTSLMRVPTTDISINGAAVADEGSPKEGRCRLLVVT